MVAAGALALSDRGAGVPLRELALVGLTAAIITYFATGWVRVLATRLGAVAYPRDRDVHTKPTPRMGGLAMYIGVVAAVVDLIDHGDLTPHPPQRRDACTRAETVPAPRPVLGH